MGIDIYARWDDQTDEEHEAQITGFDVTRGEIGYLRESYAGEHYATRVLMPESFREDGEGPYPWITRNTKWNEPEAAVAIPASVLRERLPKAHAETEQRYGGENGMVERVKESFEAFVSLYERLEAEGKRPAIYASW